MPLDHEELRVALRAIDMLDLKGWPAAKLQVLNECLLADGEEVTSRKISARTGMAVGTAQRYLRQLGDDKLLECTEGAGRRGIVRQLAPPDVWRVNPRSKLGRELWLRRIADPVDRDDLLPSNARNRASLRALPWGRAQRELSARTRIGARSERFPQDLRAHPWEARATEEIARDAMEARATGNFDDGSARTSASRATDERSGGDSFLTGRSSIYRSMDGANALIAQALGEVSRRTGRPVAGRFKQRVIEALEDLGAASLPALEALRNADTSLGLELLVTLVEQQAAAIRHRPVAPATPLTRICEVCQGERFLDAGNDEVRPCPRCGGAGRETVTPACETDARADDEVGE